MANPASSSPTITRNLSHRGGRLLAILALVIIYLSTLSAPPGAAASTTVASDGATGFNSMAASGGQKLLQDSYGKTMLVYVDTIGRISITYNNGDPSTGSWSSPVKNATQGYARPAAVPISPGLLRLIVEGGPVAGRISDVPITIQRDSQGNILGFIFGIPTILDSSGARNPTAILAHNGDILAAWNWANTTQAQTRALRWDPAAGWTNLNSTSRIPDIALLDRSSISPFIPHLVERQDNNNVYLLANRGGLSRLAFNEAFWIGEDGNTTAFWSWATGNLTYETSVASGTEDAVSMAWDPVRLLVVASYASSVSQSYGVFTLNPQDKKTHIDTPNIVRSPLNQDWGTIIVHPPSGDYFLFFVTSTSDGQYGQVVYSRYAGTSWNPTLTTIDSETNNQGMTVRRTGTPSLLDIVYAKGTSGQRQLKFFRVAPSGRALAVLTIQSSPNPSIPAQMVAVTGQLSLEVNGTALANKQVTVQESGDALNWTTIAVSTTSQTGQYSTTTLFPSDGIYYLRASFSGDAFYQPAVSRVLHQGVGEFIFSTAGDIGATYKTTASLAKLSSSGSHFFLAIGDLSYSQIVPETSWCNYITSKLGSNYPFELLSGNHEDGTELDDGLIDNFAACLPDRLGNINGAYGKEYYFDYPAASPLARFILISPNLNFTYGGYYNYGVGSAHYNWVSKTIDNARAVGIPWVIIGMHENCVTIGLNNCEIGPDLTNLFINKKVDLVLQGHDHTYQRSKQLTCAYANLYVPSCVSNDGTSGSYAKGQGTLFVIAGNIGQGQHYINTTDTEAGYFIRASGSNGYWNGQGTTVTPGQSNGFSRFIVTPTQMISQFVNSSGPFTDEFTITNRLPLLNIPGPQVLNETSTLSFPVTASDPDSGQTVTLSASGLVSGMTFASSVGNPVGQTFNWTPSEPQGPGAYTVIFNANDGNGGTTSATVTITVNEVNQPPLLSRLPSQRVDPGRTLSLNITATDPDIPPNIVTITVTGLTDGMGFTTVDGNPAHGILTFTPSPAQAGQTFNVTFAATDNGSPPLSDIWALTIQVASSNPPVLSPSGPWAVNETSTISFTITGTSQDANKTLTLTAVGLPPGASFNSTPSNGTVTGFFSWTPSEAQGPGTYSITFYLTDGTDTVSEDVTISVNEVNSPPSISSATSLTVNESTLVTFIVTASDPDIPANTLILSVQGLPSGASFNPPTGLFSWTPSESQGPGDYTITFTVTDGGTPSLSATTTTVIHVEEVNQPPGITLPDAQTVNVNSTLTFMVSSLDADIPLNTVTITATGLAPGMSFTMTPGNPATGVFAFTPTSSLANQNFTIIFSATDYGAPVLSVNGTVTIHVANRPVYAIVIASDGKVFRYYSNSTLTLIGWPTNNTLRQIAWRPDGSYALIVGDQATLIKYDGTSLSTIPTGVPNGKNFWTVAWKPDGSYALIGGTNGVLLKYDGVAVTNIRDPYTTTIYSLSWQPAGAYALMVGKNGLMLSYDGTTIRSITTGTNSDLNAVAWNPNGGYALAGGANGVVLKFNGTTNALLSTSGLYSPTLLVRAIAFNSQGTLALMAGDAGLILSYDGASLARVVPPSTNYLYGISWLGQSATIVGGSGAILTYANGTVTKVKTSTTSTLKAIAWTPT